MPRRKDKKYDNTLVGQQYIRQIENPDSAVWDESTRTWHTPEKKVFDKVLYPR